MTSNPLTSSAEASPANPLAWPVGDAGSRTNGGYGPNLPASFAWYDPDTSSWRTFQGSFLSTEEQPWPKFSETWPRAGTMRNGTAYQRQPLVPRIDATAYSLWPTPQASDAMRVRLRVESLTRTYDRKRKGIHGAAILPEVLAAEFATSQTGEFTEWLMGFPIGWTDLGHSETP